MHTEKMFSKDRRIMNGRSRYYAIRRCTFSSLLSLSFSFSTISYGISAGESWTRPRYSTLNTACSEYNAEISSTPVRRWRFTPSEGDLRWSYISAGDVDGDGVPEIAAGSGTLYDDGEQYGLVHLVNSEGNLLWSKRIDGYVKWASPVFIDADGDDLLDIVVGASWWSSLFAFKGTTGETLWTALEGFSQVGMNAGDIDGDGFDEIVVADYQNPRHVRAIGESGDTIWTFQTSGTTYNVPAIGILGSQRGVLFTAHAPNIRERLYFIDQFGDEIWNFPASPTPEQLANAPPELGYIPDYGYVSASIADFDGDGTTEVGFGTDLNYYVIEASGVRRWKKPTGILGTGFTTLLDDLGDTVGYQNHHYQIYDALICDLNNDGASDIVHLVATDWWGTMVQNDPSSLVITNLIYRNRLRALNGINGEILWEFDSPHPCLDPYGRGRMGEPVGALIRDRPIVVASSNDGYLYGIDGTDGTLIWEIWGGGEAWFRGMAFVDIDADGCDELVVAHGAGMDAYSELNPPQVTASIANDEVYLDWDYSDPLVNTWRIYRGTDAYFDPAPEVLIGTLSGNVTEFVDPATGYLGIEGLNAYYRIVGVGSGGEESRSSDVVGEFDRELMNDE